MEPFDLDTSDKTTKEPDDFDLWERDQSTISQIGDVFDSFIDGNPVHGQETFPLDVR